MCLNFVKFIVVVLEGPKGTIKELESAKGFVSDIIWGLWFGVVKTHVKARFYCPTLEFGCYN